MSSPVRVLFIDREPPSGFMAVDRRLLAEVSSVERLVYPGRLGPTWAARCLAAVRRNEVVYAFFASEHALVPALAARALGRRIVLVPGGYDYANVPQHRYGLQARRLGWLPKLLGQLCDVALPISDQTLWEFLALVPSAAPRTARAYLALDPDAWSDPGVERDPAQVVTVGRIDEEAWSRKGIDRFVAAASADPGRRYVLAGELVPTVAQRVASLGLANLACPGRLDHDELRRLLWSSAAYAQLSWHETFGVAMAEAMLCGCVPVIGESAALAEVAGPWGVRAGASACPGGGPADAGDGNVASIARALDAAAAVDRAAMAADVASRFSLARRRQVLRDAVGGSVPLDPGPTPAAGGPDGDGR